jgi:hypothetical protein
MGGRALNGVVFTRRYEKNEYFKLRDEVTSKLIAAFGRHFHFVAAYSDKESFGDLDIVVDKAEISQSWLEGFIIEGLKSKGLVKNSDVWSFEYKEFQIDLVFAVWPDWTVLWMDFNDVSNLVGRVAHKFGLKFGQNGMYLPVRDGDEKLGEILVSRNFDACLDFLGFDSAWHERGFDSLDDIYRFVSSSKYFNKDIYLLDNRNAKSRIRDAKRPTYTGFLKYCETLPSDHPKYEFNPDKSSYLDMIFDWFQSYHSVPLQYNALLKERASEKAFKLKFNGGLVRGYTGLEGKELGIFMTKLRGMRWLMDMAETQSQEMIEMVVKQLYRELNA